MRAGDALPEIRQVLDQERIDAYAQASGDHNPLHVDAGFAAGTQFGGTIAHGMHQLALLNQVMTAAFGERWLTGGRMKVRFRAPARAGIEVVAGGRVAKAEGGQLSAALELAAADGEVLVTAEASLAYP
ncbi:MAG: acyl dehydratase [Dehalococcoidia bacterium]|nr:acyl dehydratase [Dehalococcoidia bacterium]